MQTNTKQNITAATILIMLTALFLSRAILTFSTILFFVTQLVLYKDVYFKKRIKNYSYLVLSTIVLLTLLSFLNSDDKTEWQDRFIVKLPILLIGIAFCSVQLSILAITMLHTIFIVLVFGGTIYTMSCYYLDPASLQEQYSYAKVLPTILDNDHIRFSWCVVIAILLIAYQHSQINATKLKVVNAIIGIWLFVFLHILGSKTGLLMCYTGIIIYSVYQIKFVKKQILLLVIAAICITPFVAYYTLPTFKKRVDYIRYDFSIYKNGGHQVGLSDGMRMQSIKAGWEISTQNLATGVGYGDIKEETNKWYNTKTTFADYEKILPSSQLLLVLMATGVVGFLLFIVSLAYPLLLKQYRKNIYFTVFYCTALLSFIFEISLEGQYGVFIFSFFTAWFMYLANQPNKLTNASN